MKQIGVLTDYLKASRAASRKEEMLLLGPDFHSKHAVHKSKKTYSRKSKHKDSESFD